MTSQHLVSDAVKHSLLLSHVCTQDNDKPCLENGHVHLYSGREVALNERSSTQIYTQKASQTPEVSSENMVMIPYSMKVDPLQFEGKTKKPQIFPACNDSLDIGAPLSVLPCEVLSEIENNRLLEPLSNWSTSNKSLDSLHLYEKMDLHFFEGLNSFINIGLCNHQNQENDLYGTKFHTSQNTECSGLMKVKFGQPVFTYTNSSNTIKSTTSDARQLEQFLECPVNSVSDQSSKISLIQMGDELSAALQSGFRRDFGNCDSETQNKAKQSCSFNEVEFGSGQICIESDGDLLDFPSLQHEMIDSGSGLSLFSESKENLLDAVVTGFPCSVKPSSCSVTIDEFPSQFDSFQEANLTHTLIKPYEKTSEALEFSYNRAGYQLEDSKQVSFSTEFQNTANATSKKELISMVQNLVKDESGRGCKEVCIKQENQGDKPMISRKRSRTEKTTRPRPKDRQQIQDRVQELRVIVPNANKCSIDALLLRTIAYIKFLHTITQHDGRWSCKGKIKMARNEAMTVVSEESKHGASWIVDLNTHGEIQGRHCPINVENLSQPGQMLVEILYEEEGIFLEIANNIRELGLTILKGVMEVRNGHIWARFVVESVRDIHRLEVLWSLTHILESAANKRENTGISY